MKSFDYFLPHILPYAPGCPQPAMYFGIRQAAIEFCERTRLWRYEDEFEAADEFEPIVSPTGSVIHEIEQVLFEEKTVDAATTALLDERYPNWRAGTYTGMPAFVTQTEPNTLFLVPFEAGTVNLALWLKPSEDAEELPDFMVDQYRRVIADGALGHILAMPNQKFTNFDLSMAFAGRFQAKLDALSAKAVAGQQRAPLRTKAHTY